MAVPPRQPWDERDLNGGDWRYDFAARTATFGWGDTAFLTLGCAGPGSIMLTAGLGTGDRPQRVDLSTSFGVDALAMTSDSMAFAADDPRLDRIAFSRGRFALDAANGSSLTIPVHAEIGRVIEDCRG